MYVDAQNRPSNGQSLAVAAGTTVSTDSIDLLTNIAQPGRSGSGLRARSVVTTAFAGGTSVQAQLISSENANLSSPTVLASGPVTTTANATRGAELLDVPMPDTSDRYLGFQYVTVGTHTAGAVSSMFVAGSDRPATDVPMNTGL